MKVIEFDQIKNDFKKADVDGKINIYKTTEGLTQEQYMELLKLFPLGEIDKLEKALG